MKVSAKLNYLHISPRKVRAVVGVVKKMNPKDALNQLRFIPNMAARPLSKLINSAIANAENNFSLDTNSLKISEFKVDGGPVFSRFRPGSRGRVSPLKRKTSHITLVLEGQRAKGDIKKQREEAKDVTESDTIVLDNAETDKAKEENKNIPFKQDKRKTQRQGPNFVRRIFQRKSV
ncbi:MAG: 50S ribosomal protein L22 [Patescibacteria group bacterium]